MALLKNRKKGGNFVQAVLLCHIQTLHLTLHDLVIVPVYSA